MLIVFILFHPLTDVYSYGENIFCLKKYNFAYLYCLIVWPNLLILYLDVILSFQLGFVLFASTLTLGCAPCSKMLFQQKPLPLDFISGNHMPLAKLLTDLQLLIFLLTPCLRVSICMNPFYDIGTIL